MISTYYGHDVNLSGLRQRFQFSLSGANIRHVMQVANQLSFSSRALRVELDTLAKVKLPCILHWAGEHFVVLHKIEDRHVIVHDPARGRRKVSITELSSNFTGIVLEIAPTANFEPIEARRVVKISHLWKKLHGLPSAIIQIISISIVFQLIAFVLPLQIQLIIDEAIANSDREILLVISVGFLGLISLHVLIEAIRNWLLQLLGQQFIFQIISNIGRHLLRLPTSFFEKRHLGDILSRMQSTRVIQDVMMRGLASALIDGAMALIAASLLFFYSTKLAAIVIATFSVIVGLSFIVTPLSRRITEEQLVANAKEQSFLMETIRAITTIKLLGRENERESSWRNYFIKSTNLSLQITKLQTILSFAQNFTLSLQYILIAYFGARMIIDAEGFSVGMLMAFLSFRQTFSDRATTLLNQLNQFRLLSVHIDRLGDIVGEKKESDTDGITNFIPIGEISVNDISFRYGESDPYILKNLDLTVRPGEFIAITGVSGEGKSTLLKLLLGLYPPSEGKIILDGNEANSELWRAWRTHIGLVAQDDKLLSGSVAENIAFFDPQINMQRVMEVAKEAFIHDEIMKKPMQYQTLIGDMGVALSGGQKQRILLARALYRNPKVLILDEGTANLDTSNELAIANYVASLKITRIVVAHRPALIERAERVLHLQNGSLVEIRRSSKMPEGYSLVSG